MSDANPDVVTGPGKVRFVKIEHWIDGDLYDRMRVAMERDGHSAVGFVQLALERAVEASEMAARHYEEPGGGSE